LAGNPVLNHDTVASVTDFMEGATAAEVIIPGIAAEAQQALALLDIPDVAGVNISGPASERGPEFAAQIKAELVARIRERSRV
jgi:hypothetical protein